MDIEKVLSQMSVEEKAALVSGTDFMYTNPIPSLGVPSLSMADGPHGLRKQSGGADNGVGGSAPATSFPTAACTAAGFNPDNLRRMGEAIAEECRYYGVNTLLGPGVNIKRDPLCGRNFEYFSEDPLLSGVLGAAMVEGVQSRGVGVSVKHFALNNSENFRLMGNSVASENTMRKLYLKAFEYIVRHARPATVMCAYNQINGVHCSENGWLLTDVLRNEWGFDGVVMSDWGAVKDRVKSLKAGMDLEMPGDTAVCRRAILDGISDGSLSMEDLDRSCLRILKWVDRYAVNSDPAPVDWEAHHELASQIASDCAVLMKNDGVLPLSGNEKLCIAGELYSVMRYQGAGSSMINPTRVTTPRDAFEKNGVVTVPLEECDTVVYFAGLTDEYESEGYDREHMRLPDKQLAELNELCESGRRIVVILFGGSPVELPFRDRVDAILNMYLPGQNGGKAVYDLLFGKVNPSGKLPESWPVRYEDVPCSESFGKDPVEVYAEGTEVGYRYYNAHNIPVAYPFGHGLSYTSFEQTQWEKDGDCYTCSITNTGERYGAQVAMLFLRGELRGFEKVYLSPGETKTVRITPERSDDRDYPDGYTVPAPVSLLPLTAESRFTDFRRTFMGRIIFRAVLSVAEKQIRQAQKLPQGPERDNRLKGAYFLKKNMESNTLRSMSMCAGSTLPYNFALGLVETANGRIFKAIRYFLSPIRVPKLPKDE